jgi:2'-5' RNA ligase
MLPYYIKTSSGPGNIARLLNISPAIAQLFVNYDRAAAFALAKMWQYTLDEDPDADWGYDNVDLAQKAADWLAGSYEDIDGGSVDSKWPEFLKKNRWAIPEVSKYTGDDQYALFNELYNKAGVQLPIDESQAVLSFPDGFKWVVLTSPEQYAEEGFLMSHCGAPTDGDMYSLRDANGLPHITAEVLELSDTVKEITQVYGRGNSDPSPKYQSYIDAFFKHMMGKTQAEWTSEDDERVKQELGEDYLQPGEEAAYLEFTRKLFADEGRAPTQDEANNFHATYAQRTAAVNIVDEPEHKSPQPVGDLSPETAYPAGEQPSSQSGAPSTMKGRPLVASDLETTVGEAIGEASMCWDPIPEGAFDSSHASDIIVTLLDAIRGKTAETGQDLGDLTTTPAPQGDSKMKSVHDQGDSYTNDNTGEGTIHMGIVTSKPSVYPPHSSGDGPLGERFDDTDDIIVHATVGTGCDPYRIGSLYSYAELLPQHQHEVDINWKRRKGRHFMWLRTSMHLPELLNESRQWYDKNRDKKWKISDRERVVDLAEVFMKGATVTPLLVSPAGEKNGGLWEGYHRLNALHMLDTDAVPVLMKVDLRDQDWKIKLAGEHREPWIAVDLDGTILNEGPHEGDGRPPLGEPFPGAKEVLQGFMDQGYRVSIWTARQYFEDDNSENAEWQTEIDKHLKYHQIPYTDIYVGKKPPADVFIDNKAIHFDGSWPDMTSQTEMMLRQGHIRLMSKQHSGCFIGLNVPVKSARAVAVEGGESPDDMHITMFYQKGLSHEDAAEVERIWTDIWDLAKPIRVKLHKTDIFDATKHSDDKDVLICPVDSQDLHDLHDDLLIELEAAGIELDQTFPEYKPHVTLKYLDDGEEYPDAIRAIEFEIDDYIFDPGSGEIEKDAHDGTFSVSDDAPDAYTNANETRQDLSIDRSPSTEHLKR